MRRLVPSAVRHRDRHAPRYSATGFPRHWLRRLSAAGLIAGLALATAGCSYRLESIFFKDKAGDGAEVTGSVPVRATMAAVTAAEPLAEADLVHVRRAALDVMGRAGKDISQPWENPATGARGMVTPLSHAYEAGGQACRDFLASYVRNRVEVWMQGEACRLAEGKWEIRSMKPWKRS